MLEFLFVPSEERITVLTSTVSSKFSFIDSVKGAINSVLNMLDNVENAPKLTLKLGSTKYTAEQNYTIIDLSWYAPFKSYGDLILTGFIYIFFLWRLFLSVPSVINGLSGSVQPISDIRAFNGKDWGGKK